MVGVRPLITKGLLAVTISVRNEEGGTVSGLRHQLDEQRRRAWLQRTGEEASLLGLVHVSEEVLACRLLRLFCEGSP